MKKQHIKAIKKLEAEISSKKDALGLLMEIAFPAGSTIEFTKGGHWIVAEVLNVNKFSHSVWIRSHTGKEYSVDLYWIMKGKG